MDRSIGKRLRELRQERDISQDALAAKANVTGRTVSRIERGGDASPRTIKKLARALKVEASELEPR